MAIQATSEEQLRLKKRARQRLLGAATLLITAAIVLPMLLDQTPRPVSSDIAIDMPGAVTAPATLPAPVVAPSAVKPAVTQPAAAPESIPVQPAAEVAHAAQQQMADARLAQQQADERKVAEAKATQAEQAKLAHDKEVAHQAALATEKAQQAAKAKEDKAKEDKAKEDKAKEDKAKEDKAKAVAASAAKSDAGHGKAESVQTADKHQSEADAGRYVVQLGAFSSAENVRQLRERLNSVGVSTYTENLPSGATRVRSGPFAERGQADKVLAKINAAGIQAQIVALHK